MVITTDSEAATVEAGRTLGRTLQPGDVVLLEGTLGAGKTAFVRGLADGLGCSADDVSSPTFTIVQEYRGPVVLEHADLYRLSPDEVDDLGLEDLMDGRVLVVEWAERWRRAPPEAIHVAIEIIGDDRRRITIAEQVYSTR